MEIRDRKEELIRLIKRFDNKCPDCGKMFLGATLYAETEIDYRYVNGRLRDYLSCGKCPECAENCYNNIKANLQEYIKEAGRIPCYKETIFEYFNGKDEDEPFDEIEIREFVDNVLKIECKIYLDEEAINKQFEHSYHGKNIQSGKLIDLFELFGKLLEDNSK